MPDGWAVREGGMEERGMDEKEGGMEGGDGGRRLSC